MPTRVDSVPRPVKPPISVFSLARTEVGVQDAPDVRTSGASLVPNPFPHSIGALEHSHKM
jgi:hypothetical protein